MILKCFPCGPFATNTYLIADPQTLQAAVIDPAQGSLKLVLDAAKQQGVLITQILLTHSHLDHTADLAPLKAQTQAKVLIHSLDAPNVRKPGADGLGRFMPVDPCEPDGALNEGDVVTVGNLKFVVIHTPGHSPGGVCLYCASEKTLISGDTLFAGSIGNLSFPGCDPEKMWVSLSKLAVLPPDTKVYPGHGPSTTIGQEHWLPHAREVFGG